MKGATGWIMERLTWVAGVGATLMIVAMLFYLSSETRYAFNREFPYGFRFALKDPSEPMKEEVGFDPYNSFLGAHPDGSDGLDEKEETIPMPSLSELKGIAKFGTGAALDGKVQSAAEGQLYRDDWHAQTQAAKPGRFLLYAFATGEYTKSTMRLRWEPDGGFDPSLTPFRFNLRLIQAPPGVDIKKVAADLSHSPKGYLDLPSYIAKSDEDRTKGYLFELTATPSTNSNTWATLGQLNRSEWAPTNRYPRFGIWPLLVGTLSIAIIALLIATPLSVLTALYLSEIARPRLGEWLKPIIELLASVPTVVLGFFGLMLVAPALVSLLGQALHMESGRCLLTAALIMSVLVAPTMISVFEDALRAAPGSLRDGALALGLTGGEMMRKVLLPAVRPGLIAALLLGFARAVGETMIVWILSGGAALLPQLSPKGLAGPVRGIPDTVGIEMANVEFEMPHYGHLFLIGLILFLITTAVNLTGYWFTRRRAWQL